eukprot:CAMPEP_0170935564 /NCGR_PEP_ID=MMETSP0735-20130129/19162_1 /TAXON_ID=186038 /ORGANISM="Fragilariopsis kerguelensis, Strain L26-C5" /LENGTH=58 /DNA_ID=CAMNT_0011339275 /DNA_START=105 /DNA_END=278 /DNA_ORIENTATION=-
MTITKPSFATCFWSSMKESSSANPSTFSSSVTAAIREERAAAAVSRVITTIARAFLAS